MILCEWQCCGPGISRWDSPPPPNGAMLTAIVLGAAVDSAAAPLTAIVTTRHTGEPAAMITAVVQARLKWLLDIRNAAARGTLGNVVTHNKGT